MKVLHLDKLRTTARFILENAMKFEWSLQGLGMLRLYLPNETRLHVWDTRFAYPGASPIHDHQQWSLHSTVISGRIVNYRYIETEHGAPFTYKLIKAGYGCLDKSEEMPIKLERCNEEIYRPGEFYCQLPEEIHQTIPMNGTVTIMKKWPTKDPEAAARVFWPAGEHWGSAEPRRATDEEVMQMTGWALARWNV